MEGLQSNGLKAVSIPLLTIEKIDTSIPAFKDSVIFVSPNAVQFAHNLVNKEHWQSLNQLSVYCIGKATAEALSNLGITNVEYPVRTTSEDLLSLKNLLNCKNKSISLISGLGGRDTIESELTRRGAHVTKFEVYQRVAVPCQNIHDNLPTNSLEAIWVISSNEALQHLSHCLDKPVKLLVTSERLENIARQLEHTIVKRSQSALTEDIIRSAMSL
ncbi:uroporphyrinogen-III synthase [Pleionea sediminis]|uniref:uroporphyrinogen-III synthase n=1 Tax=Pleionea sediminis TaxID=2569479 RepID=UPI0013DE7697|nr:uroporphyrinogen-III synthase [Pleionea sediminis]